MFVARRGTLGRHFRTVAGVVQDLQASNVPDPAAGRSHLYWYTNCVAPSIGTDRQIHCKKGAVLMANPNVCKH